jgi:ArsR family transcriptional regulator
MLIDSMPHPGSNDVRDYGSSHAPAETRSSVDANLETLSPEATREISSLFKLFADPTRVKILYFLIQKEEINVRTLCEALKQSQPAVSHHLALMRKARLLDSRRDGKHNFYRLQPERFKHAQQLLSALDPMTDDSPETVAERTRTELV